MAKDEKLQKTTGSTPEKAKSKDIKKAKKQPGKVARWYREMKSELKKVIWPTAKSTASQTGIALVTMFVVAVVIWGFDTLASAGVRALILLTAG